MCYCPRYPAVSYRRIKKALTCNVNCYVFDPLRVMLVLRRELLALGFLGQPKLNLSCFSRYYLVA